MDEYTMTIGGAPARGDAYFDVVNPATGEPFGRAPQCSPAQLDHAMQAAASAWREWSSNEAALRAAMLSAAKAVAGAASRIGATLTREQGKPLAMATGEVYAAAASLRHHANLELGPEILQDDRRAYAELVRRPVGVVVAIAPWNFPVAVAVAKIGPALRAGNAVVLKPSPFTPLSTLQLGELLREALPPGVLNIVSGDDALGAAMVAHPTPGYVGFTGSVETGRRVAGRAGGDLKGYTLELGGNDAGIVLDDVDPDDVAERLFWDSFANNGQACVLIKRLYVASSRYSRMVDALADRARAARVGDPMVKGTQLGPVSNLPQLNRVQGLVEAALAAGGRAISGGKPWGGPGYFFPPVILSDVDDGMAVVDEEQFGPALPVVPYRDVDDAVRRANATHFGLGGSVWSADPERAWQVAARLECGTAWVNSHAVLGPDQPFAGLKCSGIGVENGLLGLYEYTTMQVRHRPALP